MVTGITLPILSCVRALNCLQNSMMLIPLEPNAGPIGGAGLAWPPFTCSFTKPVISFFAIFFRFIGSSVPPGARFPNSWFRLRWNSKNFSWGGKDKAGQRIGEVLLKFFYPLIDRSYYYEAG